MKTDKQEKKIHSSNIHFLLVWIRDGNSSASPFLWGFCIIKMKYCTYKRWKGQSRKMYTHHSSLIVSFSTAAAQTTAHPAPACVVSWVCDVGMTAWVHFYQVTTLILFLNEGLVFYKPVNEKYLCAWLCRRVDYLWTSVRGSPRCCLSVTTPAPAGGLAGTEWSRRDWGTVLHFVRCCLKLFI